MLTTEMAARDKWCPMTGYRSLDNDLRPATRCIAADCMAWRWVQLDHLGYCGAAGVPGDGAGDRAGVRAA